MLGSLAAPQSDAFFTSAGHVSSKNSIFTFSLLSSACISSKIARLSTSPFWDWKRSVNPPLG